MNPLTYLSLLLDAIPDEVAAAEAECGSLGVLRIDPAELPEGVTMSEVRMCAGAYPGPGPGAFAKFRQYLPGWVF
ncbi:hypothetical protein PENCOP_c009G01318 [Penicillium coprophilum]|uniref:Uncharacterized protein n=1 Tax=Penicillium coprophilum TaxID=36646 RepID=A0A1V6UH87_9EURO|nr:hypothetical protein PENCOP_c009G01318 [Penicillium coprophilum]